MGAARRWARSDSGAPSSAPARPRARRTDWLVRRAALFWIVARGPEKMTMRARSAGVEAMR